MWDVGAHYLRRGDMASDGIGPQEIIRLTVTDTLAVANGGIRTDPATGGEKLNFDTMRPNLTLMRQDGAVLDVVELPIEMHQNSPRHIAAFADGRIAVAFQWQGDPFDAPSIAGLYMPDQGLSLIPMSDNVLRGLDGYAGSVAVVDDRSFAVTFPRGGLLQIFETQSGASRGIHKPDICGIAAAQNGGLGTDGLGHVYALNDARISTLAHHERAFDNHLIRI